MKLRALAFIILSFSMIAFSQQQEPTDLEDVTTDSYRSRQFLNLTVGIDQDIKLPPLPANVDFGGTFREFVKASISRELNVLRFSPKKEGSTVLTILDSRTKKVVAEYNVSIKKSRLDGVANEMRALLGDVEGIVIKVVNNRVVIDGQVLLPKDLSRIYNVVQQFGDQASSLVTLSPLALKKITEYISRDINNPEIDVRAVNEKIILSGYANNEDEKTRAEIIAKTYMPDLFVEAAEEKGVIKKRKPANDGVINLINVKDAPQAPPPKMVQMVVHYVELKKDYSKAFKFEWRPGIASDGTQVDFRSGESGSGLVSTISGTINSLIPKLNWAKQHGYARVLESTSLIVQDQKKGEIKQLTKTPYPVLGKEGTQGTAFADVGIVSSITPRIMPDKSGSVEMDMQFSISTMVGTANGAPITSENVINSLVTVRDRQSAAIGGLIRNSSSTGYNRPSPGGVTNPIVSLYASKDFQRDQSQFVVFVTPVIKTSASQGSEQIKKKFRLRD